MSAEEDKAAIEALEEKTARGVFSQKTHEIIMRVIEMAKRAVETQTTEGVAHVSSYPQYYDTCHPDFAYLRRDSDITSTLVRKNGEEISSRGWTHGEQDCRKRLTKSEALSRLSPVAKTVQARLFVKKKTAVCYWSVLHPGNNYRELIPDGSGGFKIDMSE